MELNSLRYFICIANHLSFSKAAQALYISQPALSYHISNLEKELGTPLFLRDRRQISLTEAGRILLEESEKICQHIDAAYNRISSLAESTADTLRFGFLELLITPCFNRFISPFLSSMPHLHGVMERCSNTRLLDELLVKHTYDFAFSRDFLCHLWGSPENLSYRPLLQDNISIIVPQNHPCAQSDTIRDLSPLNDCKLLMMERSVGGDCYEPCFKRLLQNHGHRAAAPDYYTRNMDDLLGQVAAGRGFSIVPFHSSIQSVYHGAKLIRLEGEDVPNADIVLVWDNSSLSPLQERFLDFIESNFSL